MINDREALEQRLGLQDERLQSQRLSIAIAAARSSPRMTGNFIEWNPSSSEADSASTRWSPNTHVGQPVHTLALYVEPTRPEEISNGDR